MAKVQASHEQNPEIRQGEEDRFRFADGATLAAMVLLASALRLYRLEDQSLWYDDLLTTVNLGAPDLAAFLRLGTAVFPEAIAAPLYDVLEFFFAKWTGLHGESLRILPVALAVTAVPLMYGFVRSLFGRKAGLAAALCLAMSPQHIWYAQALRPYEMTTPLAVVSAWTFMHACRKGRTAWWVVNLVVNAVLVGTHLLMALLIVVEGVYLLATSLHRLRRVVLWGLCQMLLLVPSMVALCTIPFANHFTSTGMAPVRAFINLFGSDIVLLHTDLLPDWKRHGAEAAVFPWLIPPNPLFSLGLLAVFIGVTVWALSGLALALWRRQRGVKLPQSVRRRLEDLSFLLLLLLLPGILVGLMGLKTIVYTRYFMFNQIGLYALVGAAMAALPGRFLRRGALLGLAGLYAFQLAVFLPEVTRTNWKGAAAHIRDNASPRDAVIVVQHFFPDLELEFYLSPDWSVRRTWTLQAACDDAARILQAPPGGRDGNIQDRVWIVFQEAWADWVTDRQFDCVTVLLQAFEERGLRPVIKEFPGQHGVLVCMAERCGLEVRGIGLPVRQIVPSLPAFGGAVPPPINYDAVLDELGFQGEAQDRRDRLRAELRESVDHWPLDERFPASNRFSCIWPVLDMVCRGHCELARALAKHLLACHPDFGMLHMAVGAAMIKEGQAPAAGAAFAEAARLDPNLGRVLAPLREVLARGMDVEALCDEVRKLERAGLWFAPELHGACCPEGHSLFPVGAKGILQESTR